MYLHCKQSNGTKLNNNQNYCPITIKYVYIKNAESNYKTQKAILKGLYIFICIQLIKIVNTFIQNKVLKSSVKSLHPFNALFIILHLDFLILKCF